MANMNYCRFQNTAQDLQDCRNNFDDDNEEEVEDENWMTQNQKETYQEQRAEANE